MKQVYLVDAYAEDVDTLLTLHPYIFKEDMDIQTSIIADKIEISHSNQDIYIPILPLDSSVDFPNEIPHAKAEFFICDTETAAELKIESEKELLYAGTYSLGAGQSIEILLIGGYVEEPMDDNSVPLPPSTQSVEVSVYLSDPTESKYLRLICVPNSLQ